MFLKQCLSIYGTNEAIYIRIMSEPNPFAGDASAKAAPKTLSPKHASEPTWLKTASPPRALPPGPSHKMVAPAPPPPPPASSSQAAASAQGPTGPSGPTPALITYMRVGNFALCILMCVAAILTVIVPASATPASWVLAFYVLAFSCLLCCFEFNLKQVAKHIASNFGFLYDAKSRAIFLIFVGVLCFSLGITGKIAGAAMIANSLFNTYVLCKYPEYQRYRPPTAEESATAYMRSNPELSRKAGTALLNQATSQGGGHGQQGGSSWI